MPLDQLRYSAWRAGRRDLSEVELIGAAIYARLVGDHATATALLMHSVRPGETA